MKTPFQRWMDRWFVAVILAFIGLPFVIAGSVIFVTLPRASANTAQQIHDLPLATVASLPDPGATVMLQGTISESTPTVHETLVAYRILRRSTSGGETTWQSGSGESPTLWLDLSDGVVQIEADYTLVGHSRVVAVTSASTYEGIQAGDRVFILGTVTALATDTAPPLITTDIVNFGSQEDYLQALDQHKVLMQGMGIGFLAVGVGLLLGSGVAVFYTLRRA